VLGLQVLYTEEPKFTGNNLCCAGCGNDCTIGSKFYIVLGCSEFRHEGTKPAAFWAIKYCQYKLNVHLAVD